ncbi:MAG: hypothetical protein PVG86_08250, partial [Desulfobacterales bacterium]
MSPVPDPGLKNKFIAEAKNLFLCTLRLPNNSGSLLTFNRINDNILYTILMKLHMVSLGCAKNLVDSELMLGRLVNAGWTHTQDPGEADIIIINTCSFIEPAINESIDTILALAKYKHDGLCRRLIVAGCLPERF